MAQDGSESSGPPPIAACLSGEGAPSSGGDGDGSPGCVGVDPVCAESDMAITQGMGFEDLTQGCQCCFQTTQQDADPFAVCITQGMEFEGTCDNDQELYVSVACSCLVFC